MFVSKSKHLVVVAERDAAISLAKQLIKNSEALKYRCKVLERQMEAAAPSKDLTFPFHEINDHDLKVMIGLCHPDKHQGREGTANDILRKLLDVKAKRKT